MSDGGNRSEKLAKLASETIESFELIANAAEKRLADRGIGLEALANPNQINSERAYATLTGINDANEAAYRRLRDEPAIARLVVQNEEGKRETIYVARVMRVDCGVNLCSYPHVQVEPINIAYRQSRKLNELARALVSEGGEGALGHLPENMNNPGVPPVLGKGLGSIDGLVTWLAKRISEIEEFQGKLPSIAVLVNGEEKLDAVAAGLNEALRERNLQAMACPDGRAIGSNIDVRIFEIEHIKGLEFEAVFFVDVDVLEKEQQELFDKYLYVGATRAATYLGLTISGDNLPSSLERLKSMFGEDWSVHAPFERELERA